MKKWCLCSQTTLCHSSRWTFDSGIAKETIASTRFIGKIANGTKIRLSENSLPSAAWYTSRLWLLQMSITLALDSKGPSWQMILSLASWHHISIILPQKSAILQLYFFLFDIHPSCLSLTVLFPPNPFSHIWTSGRLFKITHTNRQACSDLFAIVKRPHKWSSPSPPSHLLLMLFCFREKEPRTSGWCLWYP